MIFKASKHMVFVHPQRRFRGTRADHDLGGRSTLRGATTLLGRLQAGELVLRLAVAPVFGLYA